MEKEKEENIWRGKMSPWQDKQQTREDLDFLRVEKKFWVELFFGENFFFFENLLAKICLCEKNFGKIFLGKNFFLVKFFLTPALQRKGEG